MKALTVKQPWAHWIVSGQKNVENRSRRTHYRGELLIHAGTAWDHTSQARQIELELALGLTRPSSDDVPYGAIIGSVQVVNCIRDSWSPWAAPGRWHWLLRNPVVFSTPIPCRGMLGLWNVPTELEAQLSGLSVRLA